MGGWAEQVKLTDELLPLLRSTGEAPFVTSVASMAGALRQLKSPELRARFQSPTLTRAELGDLVAKFQRDVEAGNHRAEGCAAGEQGGPHRVGEQESLSLCLRV